MKTFRLPSTDIVLKKTIGGWAGRIPPFTQTLIFRKAQRGHWKWNVTLQGHGIIGRGLTLSDLAWCCAGFSIGSDRAWVNRGGS